MSLNRNYEEYLRASLISTHVDILTKNNISGLIKKCHVLF